MKKEGTFQEEEKVFSKEGITKDHSAIYTESLYLPNIHRLKPSPQSDGMRRWALWDVIRS